MALTRGRFQAASGAIALCVGLAALPLVAGAPVYKEGSCVKCHAAVVKALATTGGSHRDLECTTCHEGHPPAVKAPYPECGTCHEPHSEDPASAGCAQCHRAHAPAEVRYSVTVPAQACGACHGDAAAELAATTTKHGALACTICHRESHTATLACGDCHGRLHPATIMARFPKCADCHHTAHDLNHWPEAK